jgi:hypothetical protein
VKGEKWRHATKRRAQIILDWTKMAIIRLYTEKRNKISFDKKNSLQLHKIFFLGILV